MPTPEYSHFHRRQFMATAAHSLLGVTFASATASSLFAEGTPSTVATAIGKAKHIIYLFMNGAMTHIDTFDPKPGVPEGGETKGIQTKTPGVLFGENLPKLAQLSGALAVIRSLTTQTGDHNQARYLMRTAYKQLNSIRHPGLGAWMVEQKGRINRELPGNYLLGDSDRHPGAGFLHASLSPVPIAKPEAGLENVKLPGYLDEKLFNRRLSLANQFDRRFQAKHPNPEIEAYNHLYTEARRLMGSDKLDVFDLSKESTEVRDAYGQNTLGQGCLLARRLVEQGIRYVEINYGNWDMHQDLYTSLKERGSVLDNALDSLLRDLNGKGLLKETLVVLATEFGRSPEVNVNGGRDHHPGVFSGLLAGAGIKGGQVYGSSDNRGFSVDSDGVSIEDFNTTIAAAAGLDTSTEFIAPNGRPFKVGGGGTAIKDLLS